MASNRFFFGWDQSIRRSVWVLVGLLALPVAGNAQQQGLLRDVYSGISGSSLSDLTNHASFPNNPTSSSIVEDSFEAPTDVLDDYGQRLQALLTAPATGDYVFWIASDDASTLFLSTDDSPANKDPIASVPGWTSPREWDKYPEQQSSTVSLEAGQKYYVEALMKEGVGGDNLAVRWQLPNGTMEEPIPGSRLEVYGLGPPAITQQPADVTVVEGETATFQVQVERAVGMSYQWQKDQVDIPNATGPVYSLSPATLADDGSRFRCLLTNAQGSETTREALLTVQADTTAPTIQAVQNLGGPDTLSVLFSEPVETASGTDPANYSIDNGISVNSADLAGDPRTVVLKTSSLGGGITYTLTVNNVRDRASNPNTIAPDSQATFSLDFSPLDIRHITGFREPPGPSNRRTGLAISEIMYHPADRTDGRNLEFIEIYNSHDWSEDLSGFRISGSVDFTFPEGTAIPARGYLVVAPVPADIEAVYDISGVVGGFPEDNIPNGGGTIRLRNENDAVIQQVNYSDAPPYPVAADGAGHSLVLARPSYGENHPGAWSPSDLAGGSPGSADTLSSNPFAPVLINEFLAHTDDPDLDFIELYNYSESAIDLSGCILTDSRNTDKFVIPNGTSIPPRGFVSFDQNQLGFALDSSGETIYFKNPDGTRIIDAIRFGGRVNDVSTGRFPDGANSWHPLMSKTPGAANSRLRIPDVVIHELMYHPISEDTDDEFVEIYNRTGSPVDVGQWRFNDGIDFTIPADTVIPANGYLVIAHDAERLQTNYAQLNADNTLGNYDGRLADGGERIALEMPDEVVNIQDGVEVTNRIYIVVDEVSYVDGGKWGKWADGGGSSLELIDPDSDNRLASNWADSDESNKSSWSTIEHTGVLDNGRGEINELQVMLLGDGECLVDDLEVSASGGSNLVPNSTLESGVDDWVIQGNHINSGWSAPGDGFESDRSLHIRATGGGDNGANRVETDLTSTLSEGSTATLRARVRWLGGHPDLLLRVHGNHLEAVDTLPIPANLGTPGAPNSRGEPNAGPAIHEVVHQPILPEANEPVTVKAQVHDPDGLANLLLHYRLDPSTNRTTLSMSYNGAGLYSATIPGQAAGTMAAFYIEATDATSSPVVTRFPANAPQRECLVRFGDPTPSSTFGSYRFWLTQADVDHWSTRQNLSNDPVDTTFVYGDFRVVYHAGARYRGSPFIRPGYNSPVGNLCAYVLELPKDDLVLASDEYNLDWLEQPGRDGTLQREKMSFWIARQLGLPFSYQRYVQIYVNGNRRGEVYTDSQHLNKDYISSWYADNDDGEIFKIDDWFEFDDSVRRQFNVNATLQNFTTTGGTKKKARYRWSWEKKANRGLDDDYGNLFSLVDAVNTPDGQGYTQAVENLADIEQWMRVFALRHIVGDWDGYGYRRGKNMFTYKPAGGRFEMLLWDIDFALGGGSDSATHNLFDVNDPTVGQMYGHPPFERAYWRALHDAVNGPLLNANADPVMDAHYDALIGNGVSVDSPSGIKSWIADRRQYIEQQLANVDASFAVTSNNGNDFSTSQNLITLTGTAPVQVKTIKVNGIAYPATWSSVNEWNLQLALNAGSNQLNLEGFDLRGNPVSGAVDTVTVEYTGTQDLPQDHLVINEIMYHAAVPGAEFVEIHNTSTEQAFDLSGYRLNGADLIFPDGTLIEPNGFVIAAREHAAFVDTYGDTIHLAAVFDGRLDNGGETLSLWQPGDTPEQETLIDEVTYDDDAPWSPQADGFGPSLQLIDPNQDNNRVANWNAVSQSDPQDPETLVDITHTWKYNQSGDDLGTAWREPGYNDTGWSSGQALLYVENSALPAPKNTPLTLGETTYYFRTTFNFDGNPGGLGLKLSTVIDDGAIIYLNGNELLRLGMPEGDVDATTFADRTVSDAAFEGPFTLPANHLQQGSNVLAVEVHQTNPDSSDIVLGLTLETETGSFVSFTPGAVNSVAASIDPFPNLRLNEVHPENLSGPTDQMGDSDPWVELYNAGSTAVSLDGLHLSPAYTNLTEWSFPAGTTIDAGQFLIIWLDNEPGETTADELHAGFTIPAVTGSVALSETASSSTRILDYLDYSQIGADRSYGSYPDGRPAGRQSFFRFTPGAPNNNESGPAPIFINEWMANNSFTLSDPADGQFDDWFELFNAGADPVDLSGFTLTDDLANPNQFVIPGGFTIEPGGFLLVWADNDPEQTSSGGDLHTNFRLSTDGEQLGLYASDGTPIDSVTFAAQTGDVSQGRFPDGNVETNYEFMPNPTPAGPNQLDTDNQPPVLDPIDDQTVDEDAQLQFTAIATDPDSNQTLTFSLAAGAPEGATINPSSGVFSWTPLEADGPGDFNVTVRVSDDGSPQLSDSETIAVHVNEINQQPAMNAISDQAVNEGQTVAFTAAATDPDLPAQQLTYSLDEGAPAGANIDPVSGQFTWTPGEAQGPGSYSVTVVAADDGSPSLNVAQTFSIAVAEINAPPSLAAVEDQSVNEGTQLSLTLSASDPDQPAQTLSYQLGNDAPNGASVDTQSGAFTWSPSEAQGPGEFTVSVTVSDDADSPLSDTVSFNVSVEEVNQAPTLAAIEDQSVDEGTELALTLSASDADQPEQTLSYQLASDAPDGMTLASDTGLLTWTPAAGQVPSTNIVTVSVEDDAADSLSDEQTFTVIALGAQTDLVVTDLELKGDDQVTIEWQAQAGRVYRVEYKDQLTDTTWELLVETTASDALHSVTQDTNSVLQRYYRIRLVEQ